MSQTHKKSLAQEIQDDISRIQSALTGDREYSQEWLDLQKIWSKLANVITLEGELVANVNQKIIKLIQEKESMEEVMNMTNSRPTVEYANVCSNLKLLEGLLKK